MFIAITGIFFLLKYNKKLFIPVFLYFVFNLYLISSWWCWWYGGSFGLRTFVDSYAIYSLPLGVVFQRTALLNKIMRTVLFTFYFILIIINLFFSYKYRYGSIHYDSMTCKAFFDSFWRLRPNPSFYEKLETPDYDKAKKGIY
jgi:hypothetical protein